MLTIFFLGTSLISWRLFPIKQTSPDKYYSSPLYSLKNLNHCSPLESHAEYISKLILWKLCVCVCVWHSVLSNSVTLGTVAHQSPLSTEFSRQEYWSGLPFLLQGIFLTQGSNSCLLHCRQILYCWDTREVCMRAVSNESTISPDLFLIIVLV